MIMLSVRNAGYKTGFRTMYLVHSTESVNCAVDSLPGNLLQNIEIYRRDVVVARFWRFQGKTNKYAESVTPKLAWDYCINTDVTDLVHYSGPYSQILK